MITLPFSMKQFFLSWPTPLSTNTPPRELWRLELCQALWYSADKAQMAGNKAQERASLRQAHG